MHTCSATVYTYYQKEQCSETPTKIAGGFTVNSVTPSKVYQLRNGVTCLGLGISVSDLAQIKEVSVTAFKGCRVEMFSVGSGDPFIVDGKLALVIKKTQIDGVRDCNVEC
ncbi:hypothetical protein PENTCL1PPCAC_5743 [Pristionchus entomophagus]|uniref:Uncharacterized protein n=1 Tax=Pristionchus entomophagus TaxID=358040 RepID=A0AAV5SKG3_9BILA|nr:hypothetical protein PENTCL1PPCAC_5743 [Pristionchus entomophagus]